MSKTALTFSLIVGSVLFWVAVAFFLGLANLADCGAGPGNRVVCQSAKDDLFYHTLAWASLAYVGAVVAAIVLWTRRSENRH
jgi:hypothetical protein